MNSQTILYKQIDEILWNDWDPIGVNVFPTARDEYQGYIPPIFELKVKGADIETIAKKLNEIATDRMGLGNIEHDRKVAEKIFNLK